MFFTLDKTHRFILQMPGHKLHMVGGNRRWRLWRQGRMSSSNLSLPWQPSWTGKRPSRSSTAERERNADFLAPGVPRQSSSGTGIMNDGRLVAASYRLHRCRSLSRHSPYGAQKGAAHYPGPYTVPNVWDRTPIASTPPNTSRPLRGFGVYDRRFCAWRCKWTKLARLIAYGFARIPLHQCLSRRRHEGLVSPGKVAALDRMHAGKPRVSGWAVATKISRTCPRGPGKV